MNDKEAIKEMKNWIEYEKDNKEKIIKEDELIEIQETILNIIEKQQAELEKKDRQLEERTNRIRNLEKECQKYFDSMMDTINDNNFKNEIIVELTKLIFNHRNDFEWWEVGTDIDDIKQQIEYFKNKVNSSEQN